jgi:hypothetical protein
LQTGAPLADLWHAYERAQQHYEHDLELFSTRMSLFLVVQSALIALLASAIRLGKLSVADRHAVAIFGLALTLGWLLVASSSYMWVKTWRAHMIILGKSLDEIVSVDISTKSFERKARKDIEREARKAQAADAFSERRVRDRFWKLLEWFSWYVRPTLVICCLPVLFIGGWAYLGWWF